LPAREEQHQVLLPPLQIVVLCFINNSSKLQPLDCNPSKTSTIMQQQQAVAACMQLQSTVTASREQQVIGQSLPLLQTAACRNACCFKI
jgi:hypothetical protein